MTEATGFEARTIYRLLEVDPKAGGFKRNEGNCLDCDLLVVDETSTRDQSRVMWPLSPRSLPALACRAASLRSSRRRRRLCSRLGHRFMPFGRGQGGNDAAKKGLQRVSGWRRQFT
jgi:hypothetical protein